jgi:hypothetical protein
MGWVPEVEGTKMGVEMPGKEAAHRAAAPTPGVTQWGR